MDVVILNATRCQAAHTIRWHSADGNIRIRTRHFSFKNREIFLKSRWFKISVWFQQVHLHVCRLFHTFMYKSTNEVHLLLHFSYPLKPFITWQNTGLTHLPCQWKYSNLQIFCNVFISVFQNNTFFINNICTFSESRKWCLLCKTWYSSMAVQNKTWQSQSSDLKTWNQQVFSIRWKWLNFFIYSLSAITHRQVEHNHWEKCNL